MNSGAGKICLDIISGFLLFEEGSGLDPVTITGNDIDNIFMLKSMKFAGRFSPTQFVLCFDDPKDQAFILMSYVGR